MPDGPVKEKKARIDTGEGGDYSSSRYMAKEKAKKTPAGRGRRRRKPAGHSSGLEARELSAQAPPQEVIELSRAVEADGGKVLSAYREPYAGRWVLMAALPIEKVEPTPYQRKLSDTHVRRLEQVIGKIGRFLDPIIAVRTAQGGAVKYWTPNGHHRLSAMRTLEAKSITAVLVPEAGTAYHILALNTEKAHNLREKALEVIRMYQDLARLDESGSEEAYALEFEEAAFITLGLCYLEKPRFSGGAYHAVLRHTDQFLKHPLEEAFALRQERARVLLALDEVVVRQVEALKARGMSSPYLKSFVVARINPLRFRPKEAKPLDFDEALDRMSKAAAKFNPEKIKVEDLARSGGTPPETE